MIEGSDFLKDAPAWVKTVGVAAGAVGAGALALRQWLSSAKVDRATNEANVKLIDQLQEQLANERKRGDELMREREAMSREIGELRGKVETLSAQVEVLSEQGRAQSRMIEELLRELRSRGADL